MVQIKRVNCEKHKRQKTLKKQIREFVC